MEIPDPTPPMGPVVPELIPPPPSAPPEDPAWNLVDVLAVVLFWVVIVAVVGSAVGIFLARWRRLDPESAMLLVPLQTVASLVMVALMAQMVRMKQGGAFLQAISWNMPKGNSVLAALGAGVGLAVFSHLFATLLSRWMPKSVPIDKYFRDAQSAYLLAFFGVLVAPFVEELFFRGFLYPALARRIGVGGSVIFTAAIFAIIHQAQLAHAWVPLLWLFVVGLVLTTVRARTKSVAMSALIHLSYNATLFLGIYLATQGFRHMEQA